MQLQSRLGLMSNNRNNNRPWLPRLILFEHAIWQIHPVPPLPHPQTLVVSCPRTTLSIYMLLTCAAQFVTHSHSLLVGKTPVSGCAESIMGSSLENPVRSREELTAPLGTPIAWRCIGALLHCCSCCSCYSCCCVFHSNRLFIHSAPNTSHCAIRVGFQLAVEHPSFCQCSPFWD